MFVGMNISECYNIDMIIWTYVAAIIVICIFMWRKTSACGGGGEI